MRTTQKVSRLIWLTSLGLTPLVFASGCGGGGGDAITTSQNIGTYTGTYLFPGSGDFSEDRGTFVLRVQSNGKTSGIFNEGIADRVVTTSGTTNLSSGRLSLSAKFDNDAGGQATLNVTGQISNSTASGTLALKDDLGSQSGTFNASKSSSASVASSQQEGALSSPRHSSTRRIGTQQSLVQSE